MRNRLYTLLLLPVTALATASSPELEEVQVSGRKINLVGDAASASEGLISQQEIALRPLLRSGDVLELVPGMVATQHSGTGKANQYFLRGFNLDHGTDFATYVDGMPVNMRTHGHGQGYTDLNFVIPETIATLAYKKGPYYADVNDFSSAGSAHLKTPDSFDDGLLELGAGENNFYRMLLLDSVPLLDGSASYAMEINGYDGPWSDIKEDVKKYNLMLKYARDVGDGVASVSVMAYHNTWHSPDQIPLRAVEAGIIDELGSIDETLGGKSHRYSLATRWQNEHWDVSAYAIRYSLKLWSNFTYFLYMESEIVWNERIRTVLGARYDYFNFEVNSRIDQNIYGVDLGGNSGKEHDDKLALKGSPIYTFNEAWETYFSIGQGLHSNDARGTTAVVDPIDGGSVLPVDPLVDSLGYEVGARGFLGDRLNASIALWRLDIDSELLFVGDAGNTEVSRGSRRKGVEVSTYYSLTDQWTLDMEYAYTDSKFTDYAPEGDDIPGSIDKVLQAGISAELDSGWFGSLRVRYFGERPLVEDGSVKSDDATVVNLRAGYQARQWSVKVDVLNVLDSDDHDIDYFYASRLPGEASGGVEDIHYHVLEPRTVRFYVGYTF